MTSKTWRRISQPRETDTSGLKRPKKKTKNFPTGTGEGKGREKMVKVKGRKTLSGHSLVRAYDIISFLAGVPDGRSNRLRPSGG